MASWQLIYHVPKSTSSHKAIAVQLEGTLHGFHGYIYMYYIYSLNNEYAEES